MILLNDGRFKGYHLILKKLQSGSSIPLWYTNQEYSKIIDYVQMEAKAFTEFYFRVSQFLVDNITSIKNQ
jgi:hypothetical protein